jgi:hypothetical protein
MKPADQGEERDDSGMYWIGEVEPRLYFCRILRSRTTFVRIGGVSTRFLHRQLL